VESSIKTVGRGVEYQGCSTWSRVPKLLDVESSTKAVGRGYRINSISTFW